MEDSLKTEIIIKSVTKIAQQDGIPVFVVKKGDPDSGIILIKIDLLNGKGQLIRRNYSYSLKKNKSIIEIGKKLNINTYNLEQMYNLLKFKGELLGIYEKNEELEKILH